MEILRVVALDGANRFAPVPVLEARVDCRGWKASREARLRENLVPLLPALGGGVLQPTRLAGEAGITAAASAALQRSIEGSGGVASMLQHAALALQSLAGVGALFGETQETDEPGVWLIAIQYEEAPLADACLETAKSMCIALADDDAFDLTIAVRRLVDLADDARLGPSSRAIISAAAARDIPFRRLNAGSLVQLGEGRHQRRIWTAETDATSAIAESIASDKELTKRLLRNVGVPVPAGRLVTSAEDAWAAACEIGLPVVVKPRQANHALGITLDLSTREQVLAAYEHALKDVPDCDVIVEQYARGQHHRLLVVGSHMVAAARGDSEYVVGDGHHTVQQLVDEVNRDPRRGENYTDLLDTLGIDEGAVIELQKQGLTPDSVPEAGRRVLVQRIGDLTTDCTQSVHSQVAEQAVLAARVVGLDVAGLDVVSEDISKPLEEQRGMILEVNAGPSLGMHIAPLHGQPQPVGEAIIDLIFPQGIAAKIPVVAVTGYCVPASIAVMLCRLMAAAGWSAGLASEAGRFIGSHRIGARLPTDRENLTSLLMHPRIDAAVVECRPEQAFSMGSGFSRCDVVIIAPPSNGVEPASLENIVFGELAVVNAIPTSGTLVLHELDSAAERLLGSCRGNVARYGGSAPVVRSASPSGLTVFARDRAIVVAENGVETTLPTPSYSQDMSLLAAAVAGARATGVPTDALRDCLSRGIV